MMKVLIINPIMYSNETDAIKKVDSIKDTLMYNVCRGFVAKGDEVTLIASEDFKPVFDEKYEFNVLFFKTNLKRICYPRIIPHLVGLKQYLKRNKDKFDIIICSEAFSLATYTAVRVFKNKCIVWQEMAKHQKKFHYIPSKIWHNIIVRLFFRKCLFVARSEEAKEFISKYSNNTSNIIVEHGMNLDKFPYSPRYDNKQFLVVSQLIDRKQIDKIIDVFSEFIKDNKEYKLVICGEGNLEKFLKRYVSQLKISNNVVFLGQCDHNRLSELYRESVALLVYTRQDNNMVSIIESIASGTPVLTTPVPYNCRYVKIYNLGIVKEDWGKYELKEIVKCYRELSNNCIRYRKYLSSEYSAEKFHNIIEEQRHHINEN